MEIIFHFHWRQNWEYQSNTTLNLTIEKILYFAEDEIENIDWTHTMFYIEDKISQLQGEKNSESFFDRKLVVRKQNGTIIFYGNKTVKIDWVPSLNYILYGNQLKTNWG